MRGSARSVVSERDRRLFEQTEIDSNNDPFRVQGKRMLAWLLTKLDDFTYFVSLEAALIQRFMRLSHGKGSDPLHGFIRTVVIIIAHIYFFYFISRALPAGIHSVEFCTPAFTMWFLLIGNSRYSKVSALHDKSSKHTNVKWINVIIAETVIETIKTVCAFISILVLFTLLGDQRVMGTKYFPNIPEMAYLMSIAAMMGVGLRLVSEYVVPRWKLSSLIIKVLMFVVYVTCGVYSSWSSLPPLIAKYFLLNPLIHLVEYGRQAMHSGYPVWGLNTVYPLVVAGVLVFLGLSLRRLDRDQPSIRPFDLQLSIE